MLRKLSKLGKKIALLTGDSTISKKDFLLLFNFDFIKTACSAEDKLNWLQQKQAQKLTLCMVGDGFNDSLVLASANTSIAMANGASLSTNISDAVLLSSNLETIIDLVQLSKKTISVIKQNISWAIFYNVITVPLAVTGHVSPWMAAIGMSISSLFVVFNSLKINTKYIPSESAQ